MNLEFAAATNRAIRDRTRSDEIGDCRGGF
jgi:hypothetical protein